MNSMISQMFKKDLSGCHEIDYREARVSSIKEVIVIVQGRHD